MRNKLVSGELAKVVCGLYYLQRTAHERVERRLVIVYEAGRVGNLAVVRSAINGWRDVRASSWPANGCHWSHKNTAGRSAT